MNSLIEQRMKQLGHRDVPHKVPCDWCGHKEYNLYPYTNLHVCKECALQLHTNRETSVKPFDWEYAMNGEYCDICGRKTYKLWNANAYLCINCTEHLWVNNRRKHLED